MVLITTVFQGFSKIYLKKTKKYLNHGRDLLTIKWQGFFSLRHIYHALWKSKTLTWFLTDESSGMQTDLGKSEEKDFFTKEV